LIEKKNKREHKHSNHNHFNHRSSTLMNSIPVRENDQQLKAAQGLLNFGGRSSFSTPTLDASSSSSSSNREGDWDHEKERASPKPELQDQTYPNAYAEQPKIYQRYLRDLGYPVDNIPSNSFSYMGMTPFYPTMLTFTYGSPFLFPGMPVIPFGMPFFPMNPAAFQAKPNPEPIESNKPSNAFNSFAFSQYPLPPPRSHPNSQRQSSLSSPSSPPSAPSTSPTPSSSSFMPSPSLLPNSSFNNLSTGIELSSVKLNIPLKPSSEQNEQTPTPQILVVKEVLKPRKYQKRSAEQRASASSTIEISETAASKDLTDPIITLKSSNGTRKIYVGNLTAAEAVVRQVKPRFIKLESSDDAGADGKSKRPRRFICNLADCQRCFARKEHLKRHLRSHRGEKPFSCPCCKASFSRSDIMLQHMKTQGHFGNETNQPLYESDLNAKSSLKPLKPENALYFNECKFRRRRRMKMKLFFQFSSHFEIIIE